MENEDNEITALKLHIVTLEEENACLAAEAKAADKIFGKLFDQYQAATERVRELQRDLGRAS